MMICHRQTRQLILLQRQWSSKEPFITLTLSPSQKMPKYLHQSLIWKSKRATSNHSWNLKILTTNHLFKAYIKAKMWLISSSFKVAQYVTISLSYFFFSKNHHQLPKVAPLVKYCPICHPTLLDFMRCERSRGALKLTGENLKVVRAEFSTLS